MDSREPRRQNLSPLQPKNSLNSSQPNGDRMQLFDEFLGPLRDYRSSAGSELRGHQTGVAEPSKIHVQSRRLQVFHEVVRNAVDPPEPAEFSLTLSTARPSPRIR